MTNEPVKLEELNRCREMIINTLKKSLKNNHKDFLLSVMNCQPKWENIPFDNLINYPGIQWKLLNIKKMPNDKKQKEIKKLESLF